MKKLKSKQKVTDPSKIKSYEDFQKFKGTPSEGIILDYYFKQINEAAKNKDGISEDQAIKILYDLLKEDSYTLDDTKNQLWEANEARIQTSMQNIILNSQRMPTIMDLSIETGLSRKTIYSHFKNEGKLAEIRKSYMEQFKFQRSLALTALFRVGILNRDTKALKAFLEHTGGLEMPLNENNHKSLNQQNYIQINGFILTEAMVEELPENILIQLSEFFLSKQKNLCIT